MIDSILYHCDGNNSIPVNILTFPWRRLHASCYANHERVNATFADAYFPMKLWIKNKNISMILLAHHNI